MEADDDPEARIRELERPLAERARISELSADGRFGDGIVSSNYPANVQDSPMTSGSPRRILWILAAVCALGIASLVFLFSLASKNQHSPAQTSSARASASATPGPPIDSATPAEPPLDTDTLLPPPEMPVPGENVSVSGSYVKKRIVCFDNALSVSGTDNTIIVTGMCSKVTVSGVRNSVQVDTADAVEVSGFENKVTYLSGEPHISKSGGDNTVEKQGATEPDRGNS